LSSPEIAVIVPTRDRRELLLRKLASLEAQETAATFEVIVADDASTDGTAEAVTERGWKILIKLVRAPGRGAGEARNLAVAASKAPLLFFSDDDCILPGDCLEALREAALRWPGDMIVGRLLDVRAEGSALVPTGTGPAMVRSPLGQYYWINARSAHAALPRDPFEKVGGFRDLGVRYGFEDIDLGYRLHRSGVKLRYARKMLCWHVAPERRAEVQWKSQQAGSISARMAREYGDPWAALLLGVHPLLLALKRPVFGPGSPLVRRAEAVESSGARPVPRWVHDVLHERDFLRGALEPVADRGRRRPSGRE